jgi:hypothetical protein
MPTAIFSGALLFVLTWWLAGFFLGALHGGGHGGDHGVGHAGHDGHLVHSGHFGHAHGAGHDGHAHDAPSHAGVPHGHFSAARAGIADMPVSMSWLVLAFGAWATSVAVTALFRVAGSLDWGFAARVASIVLTTAIALGVGAASLAGFAVVTAPIFEDQSHPGKASAVGATCRIRIPPSVGRLGDAYVLTGPTARSIVRVEPASEHESLVKGDVVLLVGFDEARDAFLVTEIDPMFVDEADLRPM